jgi:hypothetical protein
MAYVAPTVNEFWKVAFAEETAFGTGIAIADINDWVGLLVDPPEPPLPEVDLQNHWTVDGDALPTVTTEGNFTYQGKISWFVQNGQLLKNAFGDHTVSGSSTYTHVFSGGTAAKRPLPSVSMAFWNDRDGGGFTAANDLSMRAVGVKLDGITLSGATGEPLKAESDIYAIDMDDQTAFPTGYAKVTTRPYMMHQGALTVFGSAYGKVKDFNLTIKHGIEPNNYFQQKPVDLTEGRMTIDASLTLTMFDDGIWDIAVATRASTTITLLFTRGTDDTLQIDVTGAYPKPRFNTGGERGVETTVDFVCQNATLTVIDSNATYPV